MLKNTPFSQLHPAFDLLAQSHSPLCSIALQGQIRGTSATPALTFFVERGLKTAFHRTTKLIKLHELTKNTRNIIAFALN